MYKMVNPMQYLNKKEKVGFVVMTIINTAAFVGMILFPSIFVRLGMAVMYLVSFAVGMRFILKVQAILTKREVSSHSCCSCACSEYDEECDGEEYDEDDYDEDENDEEDYDEDEEEYEE